MQLNNTTQQAQVDALRKLTTSIYQRNYDYHLPSIPIYDGSKDEDFFERLERLETAHLQSG